MGNSNPDDIFADLDELEAEFGSPKAEPVVKPAEEPPAPEEARSLTQPAIKLVENPPVPETPMMEAPPVPVPDDTTVQDPPLTPGLEQKSEPPPPAPQKTIQELMPYMPQKIVPMMEIILQNLSRLGKAALTEKKIGEIVANIMAVLEPSVQEIVDSVPAAQKDSLKILHDEEVVFPFEKIVLEWFAQTVVLNFIQIMFDLVDVPEFAPNSPDGFIAITVNGSLLTGTPPTRRGERDFQYIRIPLRKSSWQAPTAWSGGIGVLKVTERGRFDHLNSSPVGKILVLAVARAGELNFIRQVTESFVTQTLTRTRGPVV